MPEIRWSILTEGVDGSIVDDAAMHDQHREPPAPRSNQYFLSRRWKKSLFGSLPRAVTVSLLVCSTYGGPPAAWTRLAHGRFELVTSTSSNRARELLLALEQTRLAWNRLEPPLPDEGPPVRVFLFRAERDFRRFAGSPPVHGLTQRGRERTYILLPDGPHLLEAARHEFVHAASQQADPWPRWLEEGLSDYYSSLQPSGARGRAAVGGGLDSRMAVLRNAAWPDLPLLLQQAPPADAEGLFYAQSWALVTWLKQTGRFRAGVPEYLRSRADQSDEAAAFAIGFRVSLLDALEQARVMVEQKNFSPTYIEAGATPQTPPAQALTEPQALLLLADLALAFENLDLAHEYRSRLSARPAGPDATAALGMLSLQAGDRSRAERELGEAVAAGCRVPGAYFELAALRRDRRAPAAEVVALLEKAVGMSPGFAEAWFLLGRLRPGREGETALARAASLVPRRAAYWNELAERRLSLGEWAAARQAALSALASAQNQDEAEYARGLLRQMESPPSDERRAPSAPAALVLPPAPLRAEGNLTFVDCSGYGLLFHLQAGGRKWVFRASGPGGVSLTGSTPSGRGIRCGPQNGPSVRVEYLPQPDPQRKIDGELRAIEFR